jgi:malonyl-CoA O-methyltransferase
MKTPKQTHLKVKTGYDRWSKTYDTDENPLFDLESPALFLQIADVRGRKILDVGCGTGRITMMLLKMGAKVSGIDISKRMLAKARQKTTRYKRSCELGVASVYKIPYAKNKFDMVACNLVTSHLKNLGKAVAEMSRVLKTGGTIVISDLHPYIIENGGGTNFFQSGKEYKIKNYYHPLEEFLEVLKRNKLKVVNLKEVDITKKSCDVIRELHRRHGKIFPEESYRKAVGKPGALIIKAQKRSPK